MGSGRKQILFVMGLVFLLGIAAYVKLWAIDYRMSTEEALLMRQQFDLANREAMDESAEWRRRYDAEVEKVKNCIKEQEEIKASAKMVAAVGFNSKFEKLRKENVDLHKQIETLKQELEEQKLKCRLPRN